MRPLIAVAIRAYRDSCLSFGLAEPALVFALTFLVVASSQGGVCCVSCGNTVVCGSAVSASCGSCGALGEDSSTEATPINYFDLTVSVDNEKPQPYTVKESEGITIKDRKSGVSYVVEPKLSDEHEGEVEIKVKKLYSVLGWQISLNYASVRMKNGSQGAQMQKVGPFSIWSAEYRLDGKTS